MISDDSLSILSTITHVLVNKSPSTPNEPKTSSRTFLLLIRITISSDVRPISSKNVTMTDINSASADISVVPQISTFHW